MSFAWGPQSLRVREGIKPELRELADAVLKASSFDLALTEGHRGRVDQDVAFASGASQVQWPNSKHNKKPSEAVHIDPYPIDYENWLLYYALAGVVWSVAREFPNLRLRWGGDWDGDKDLNEERFRDLAHWEMQPVARTMEV